MNLCDKESCLNGTLCIPMDFGQNETSCICPSKYTGKNCENLISTAAPPPTPPPTTTPPTPGLT